MLSFYKKLDLLNRLYVLNYCNLELLEQTFIAQVPNSPQNICFKKTTYFNLNDLALLVSSLSSKKILFLMSKVVFIIFCNSREICLNSKALRILQPHLSISEFITLQRIESNEFEIEWILPQLVKLGYDTIFYHVAYSIFENITNKLGINILGRFVSKHEINHDLLQELSELPLQRILEDVVSQHAPHLLEII